MSPYQPLACELYDYVEVACLYGYRLRVEQIDGSVFEARALTTRTVSGEGEFLVLQVVDGERAVRLDQLLAITPQDAGARFGRVELGGQSCTL